MEIWKNWSKKQIGEFDFQAKNQCHGLTTLLWSPEGLNPCFWAGGRHTCHLSPTASCSGLFSSGATCLRVWLSPRQCSILELNLLFTYRYMYEWVKRLYPIVDYLLCICVLLCHQESGEECLITERSHGLELGFWSCHLLLSGMFALCGIHGDIATGAYVLNRDGTIPLLYVRYWCHKFGYLPIRWIRFSVFYNQ